MAKLLEVVRMSDTKKLVVSAMMVAVGILLPMLFHAVPNAGAVFAPMHLPVLVAGLLCGPFYGAIVGMLCPLLSSILTGMPALAVLPNMLVEMFLYGGLTGLIFRVVHTKYFILNVYIALVVGLLVGRMAGGAVCYLLFLGGTRNAYSWGAFFTMYFVTCWPAIVIQITVVPALVGTLRKLRLI